MSDIQKARDVLAKWRDGATEDRWVPRLTSAVMDSLAERERVVSFGGYSDADAELIVGTAGNPAILDLIDLLFHCALGIQRSNAELVDHAEGIAAAILSADERMSA